MKSLRSESGSYTIEATISLVAFMIAIMFIYTQIKVLIAESILQNAVNNMAKEVAAYVYIVDKVGLVFEHDENGTKNIDTTIDEAKNLMTGLVKKDPSTMTVGELKDEFSGMESSIEEIVGSIGGVNKQEWVNAGKDAAEALLKSFSNKIIIEELCKKRIGGYLPMGKDHFCKTYNVKEGSISFDNSRLFPNGKYNVFIAVECEMMSPFRMFPLNRHIAKYACSAAWVGYNTNE